MSLITMLCNKELNKTETLLVRIGLPMEPPLLWGRRHCLKTPEYSPHDCISFVANGHHCSNSVQGSLSQGFSCPDAGTLNLVISEVLTRLKL